MKDFNTGANFGCGFCSSCIAIPFLIIVFLTLFMMDSCHGV